MAIALALVSFQLHEPSSFTLTHFIGLADTTVRDSQHDLHQHGGPGGLAGRGGGPGGGHL